MPRCGGSIGRELAVKLKGTEYTLRADDQAVAVTSIKRMGDTLWCGLTSGRRCLVPFDLGTRSFREPVDIFPWIDDRPQVVLGKIHNALDVLADGRLLVGEGVLYTWDGLPFEFDKGADAGIIRARRAMSGVPPLNPTRISPEHLSTFDMRCMNGGRILAYDPRTGAIEVVGQLPFAEFVQSLVADPIRKRAYGHTLAGGHFFVVDLQKRTIEDHGRISTFAFHNMLITPAGVVFGAWIDMDFEDKLRVMRYDPAKGFLERLDDVYLDDTGPRVQGNRGIDQWLVHSSGRLYAGMVGSGRLYEFDPARLVMRDIGLAGAGGRVTCMVEDSHGRIVFAAGFPVMGVGRYDPKTGRMEHFGPVTDRFEKIYFHGGVLVDDRLFLAETDAGMASIWEVPLPQV
ncbi:MAG: hypothetical protein C0404_03300 [Verrucomicrobia bacterium]|nr:hypothetical protein [Verrucomicrobiota bacterium]